MRAKKALKHAMMCKNLQKFANAHQNCTKLCKKVRENQKISTAEKISTDGVTRVTLFLYLFDCCVVYVRTRPVCSHKWARLVYLAHIFCKCARWEYHIHRSKRLSRLLFKGTGHHDPILLFTEHD